MMIEHETYHLPIVDARGGVQGLLDAQLCLHDTLVKLESVDEMSELASDLDGEDAGARRRVNVGSIARDVCSVPADASVGDAAALMKQHDVSLVAVVKRAFSVVGEAKGADDERMGGIPRALLVGVVEADDLIKIIDEQGKHAATAPVCAVMKPPEIARAD